MFGIVSRRSGKRNLYAPRMEEVSMRPFASAINEPMLFQIPDELPNLAKHTNNIIKTTTSKSQDRQQLNHSVTNSLKLPSVTFLGNAIGVRSSERLILA
jgi:hypothetical protein